MGLGRSAGHGTGFISTDLLARASSWSGTVAFLGEVHLPLALCTCKDEPHVVGPGYSSVNAEVAE